jgi:hypothetical protein
MATNYFLSTPASITDHIVPLYVGPVARVELLIADCVFYNAKKPEPIALDYVIFVAREKVSDVSAGRLPIRMVQKDGVSPIAIVKRINTNVLQDVMQLHQQATAWTSSMSLDPFPPLPNRNAQAMPSTTPVIPRTQVLVR